VVETDFGVVGTAEIRIRAGGVGGVAGGELPLKKELQELCVSI